MKAAMADISPHMCAPAHRSVVLIPPVLCAAVAAVAMVRLARLANQTDEADDMSVTGWFSFWVEDAAA
jgi:hypothetical protein